MGLKDKIVKIDAVCDVYYLMEQIVSKLTRDELVELIVYINGEIEKERTIEHGWRFGS